MERSLLKQVYELREQVDILSTYLYMSVANSGLLGSLEQITTLTATVEALKIDVDAVEAEIVNLVAGQGTLITDVSNLTTTVTSVNSQVQLLNSGDMTISGQKTFDGTTIFNGEVDMTSTNNTIIGNTGGGITQIKGTTQINSADIGNTDIGNAGGGVTKLNGTLQLSGGAAFSPVNIPSLIGLGDINNIGGSFVRTGAGVAGYIANTSVYGLNGITLPYGRYAFTLRILISNNSATTAFLNIFPVFTTTAQVEGQPIGSVANQVLFGGQENGYRDLMVLNQTQVFNTSGLTYIDTNNFDFPIMGVNVFISINCDFQFSLAVHRIA